MMSNLAQKVNALALQVKALLVQNEVGINIIDNLETADPAQALSANMGVLIAQAIADLITEVALKAPLANAALTGNPTAPTQIQGVNNTTLANTQFVNDAVYNATNALISSAPENLNQLNEFAAALNNDPNFATTVLNSVANKLAFDVVQTLTTQQKNNVFASLGLGSIATANASDYLSVADSRYVINTIVGTSYAVQASDVTTNGRVVVDSTNGGATAITIQSPANLGKQIGDSVNVRQSGAGTVTITGIGGAVLQGNGVFAAQYETKTLIAKTSAIWMVVGG